MNKEAQQLWFDTPFVEIETEWLIMESALIQSTGHSFFVELYVSETFAQPFRFLLVWQKNEIAVWKVMLQKGKNEVGIQTAKIPFEAGEKLLEMVQTLSLPIFVNEIGTGRDGSFFKLKTGQSTNTTCFQWWNTSLPPEWGNLESLTKLIMNLDKSIEYQMIKFSTYELDYEGESSLLGENKSFFMSFKTLIIES